MTDQQTIESVAIFVRINGQTALAPIDPALAQVFVNMLHIYQTGFPNGTQLFRLPASAADPVAALTAAIMQELASCEQKKDPA